MSDPTVPDHDAHKTAPDQAPTDPSPANDLRIGPPAGIHSAELHSTDLRSTDLHNLRGLTPGQDVPAWVAEATRQTPGPPHQPAPGAQMGNASAQSQYTQNPYHQNPYTQPGSVVGNPYGPAQPSSSPLPLSTMSEIGTRKLVAGLLAIFLGSFGAHKFYLGRSGPGLVMLLVNLGGWFVTALITLVTFGIAGLLFIPLMSLVAAALGIVGLIEGIVYLTRSDEDFSQTYLVGRKDWF